MSSSQHQCWIWCSGINQTHEISREEHISSNICQSLLASLPFYTLVVPSIAPPFKVKGFDVLSTAPSYCKLGILAWNGNSCSEEAFLALEQQQGWSGTFAWDNPGFMLYFHCMFVFKLHPGIHLSIPSFPRWWLRSGIFLVPGTY